MRFPGITVHANYTKGDTRTADFAIRVTRARGSSKFSMPSETASCCACADAGVLALSFRGMARPGRVADLPKLSVYGEDVD